MLKHRIIPILLYDGAFCVHTTKHIRPVRRLGPIEQYTNNMANRDIDELILLDIEATRKSRGPNFSKIKKFTEKLMCPVAYGGGVRDIDDIRKLIQYCGVDKVVIKANYQIISHAAQIFGSQSISFALDTHGSTVVTGIDAVYWAKKMEELGAGEIIVTDINHQGTMQGYNNLLINSISKNVNIPVVANGGCGSLGDMVIALTAAGADAVAASSIFTLRGLTPQDAAVALHKAGLPVRVSVNG